MQPESAHQWKLVSWKEHRIRPHLVPADLVGALIAETMVRVGKRAAGAMLDGREHREFPQAGAR